jgi:hypothetical protein
LESVHIAEPEHAEFWIQRIGHYNSAARDAQLSWRSVRAGLDCLIKSTQHYRFAHIGTGNGTLTVTASPGLSGTITVTAAGLPGPPAHIQVNVLGVLLADPVGSFDTPIDNVTGVVGAIPITGWALDKIEVSRVDIFREPVTGESAGALVFIGTATFVAGARLDVAKQFPNFPLQFRAGWGYQMLTNVLPNSSGAGAPGNGTYKLHAIAFDTSGLQTELGTKTITVDNAHATKPFGTIDTPAQGGTISGADSVNFGWALTPQPAMIPTDGSTITVVIDGVLVGHPTYNQLRSDIASMFPNYKNSGGAVGFFHIDTTMLANGVHTISWNVFDDQGRGEGLGSRYFNVLNTGGSVTTLEDTIDESVAQEGVRVRHGVNLNRRPEPISQDADGGYSVTMEEVGHIQLHLGAASGNMLVQGEPQALPTGSTLKGGVFYWQPGPGFLGEYTMQFERPDGERLLVRVKIVPKRYEPLSAFHKAARTGWIHPTFSSLSWQRVSEARDPIDSPIRTEHENARSTHHLFPVAASRNPIGEHCALAMPDISFPLQADARHEPLRCTNVSVQIG